MKRKEPLQDLDHSLFVLPAIILVWLLLFSLGCGSQDAQTVVVKVKPYGIDFYSPQAKQSETFLYMVDRGFYMSVLRFSKTGNLYNLIGTIWPATGDTFSPYMINVATGASADVLFVTDITDRKPRLLALNPAYVGEVPLGEILYASTGGSTTEGFVDVRGVTSLRLNDDTYRLYVSDADRIWIIDFDVSAKQFTFKRRITGGCGKSLLAPYGLAVDPGEGLFSSPSLYVIDYDLETLFRFAGIDKWAMGPSCSAKLKTWNRGSEGFRDPVGVAVLPSGNAFENPLVVVADAKSTASGNDRVSAFEWTGGRFLATDLPSNFAFFPDAVPFGLAFDPGRNLFVSYPETSAVAGPTD